MGFTVKVEWQREDGSTASVDLGAVECGPCRSASDVGLALADAHYLLKTPEDRFGLRTTSKTLRGGTDVPDLTTTAAAEGSAAAAFPHGAGHGGAGQPALPGLS